MTGATVLAAAMAAAFVATPWLVFRLQKLPAPTVGYWIWSVLAGPLLFFVFLISEDAFGRVAAIAIGVIACAALAIVTTARSRHFGVLHRLCNELGSARANTVLDELEAIVGPWWNRTSRPPRQAPTWTLYVAQRALQGGHAERTLRFLDLVPVATLKPALRAAAAQYRASAHIRLGQPDRARQALAAAPRPARPALMEDALVATEVLLDVLEGREEAAAKAERALAANPAPALRPVWLAVRAHGLALRDDTEALRALFSEARAARTDLVDRIARQKGPASDSAAAFLVSEGPYR